MTKKFNRDEVAKALKNSGVSAEQIDDVLSTLEGKAPTQATPVSRGGGAAGQVMPSIDF